MANKKDLSQLRYVYAASPLHLYYETLKDGTNVLRHIRVNQRTFNVPAEGVTIDMLPANSIGSNLIEDGSVQIDDLSEEVRDGLIQNMTGDDIENIFFPPQVTGITADALGGDVILTAVAENISDDEEVTWDISFDGVKREMDGNGTTLTLDGTLSEMFRSATSVSVSLSCSDYVSGIYVVK